MLAAVACCGTASAQSSERLRLQTNEAYIEETRQPAELAINDATQVFAFVLASLPERVKVYPTENYYYFSFMQAGRPYSGSIRLAKTDRDQGKLHFGYYQTMADWKSEEGMQVHVILDAAKGVAVDQLEPLAYRVTYQGKSVVFALNDLSSAKPPPGAVGADEKFLGPIFDESAIRFFLVYNTRLKIFHFLLDETEPVADELSPIARTPRILLGRRTGFAFYWDHRAERKILVGAFEPNSRANNFFDGPFDQLPENFIIGNELYDAIVDADPEAAGQIDRLGNYIKEEDRYLVHPYMLYRKASDLHRIDACAATREKRADYYRCFVIDPDGKVDPGSTGVATRKR